MTKEYCARKTLEPADSPGSIHVVTKLGIREASNFHLDKIDINNVMIKMKEKLNE